MSAVVWRACACFVWPIALGYPTIVCGFCGEEPFVQVAPPTDGKAYPLTQEAAVLASLANVHPRANCRGRACVVHRRTEHHMRAWPLHWRNDRAIFERICPDGIGHPDPDQFAYWRELGQEWRAVHGCDGCCTPPPSPWASEMSDAERAAWAAVDWTVEP